MKTWSNSTGTRIILASSTGRLEPMLRRSFRDPFKCESPGSTLHIAQSDELAERSACTWRYIAGLQGGAPIRIDHAKVKALREEGLKYREIAEQLGISIPSVARILAKPLPKK